jgi:hypothetical protein
MSGSAKSFPALLTQDMMLKASPNANRPFAAVLLAYHDLNRLKRRKWGFP